MNIAKYTNGWSMSSGGNWVCVWGFTDALGVQGLGLVNPKNVYKYFNELCTYSASAGVRWCQGGRAVHIGNTQRQVWVVWLSSPGSTIRPLVHLLQEAFQCIVCMSQHWCSLLVLLSWGVFVTYLATGIFFMESLIAVHICLCSFGFICFCYKGDWICLCFLRYAVFVWTV